MLVLLRLEGYFISSWKTSMWHLTWQGSCHILGVTSLHPSLSPLQMEVMGQIPQAWQLAEVGGSLPLDSDCFSLTLVFGWDTDEFCCQKKKKNPSAGRVGDFPA